MRSEDWREIACQWPEGTSPTQIAMIAGSYGEAWCAHWRGQPVAAFGAVPITVSVLSIWAWGNRSMVRAIPAVTRFITGELVPRWIGEGVTRVEARSVAGHDTAHKWMRSLGASAVPLPCFGRNGENFILFGWTRKDWRG